MDAIQPIKERYAPGIAVGYPNDDGISYQLKTVNGGTFTQNRRFMRPGDTQMQMQQCLHKNILSARPI